MDAGDHDMARATPYARRPAGRCNRHPRNAMIAEPATGRKVGCRLDPPCLFCRLAAGPSWCRINITGIYSQVYIERYTLTIYTLYDNLA